jgi:hypothetical protein
MTYRDANIQLAEGASRLGRLAAFDRRIPWIEEIFSQGIDRRIGPIR